MQVGSFQECNCFLSFFAVIELLVELLVEAVVFLSEEGDCVDVVVALAAQFFDLCLGRFNGGE